ncbi:sulfotransferase family 2 domain-containing protein [Prochlorococcus sp. MIT 1303]|uniref:sulfotransferase family 2 domain-containing protein n=1 Tax=Prochlorococcus sp. MIT 1303 TaxID=1723647 RepID=UPI0007B3C3A3|nr:sulfotransferase family 2 domain-containing protein [Prochlorococcus sp. MIT 1303]KZR61789.1 Sulfotransferase family protein [Prochlorococcus sp. MIT 1303]
MIIRHDLKLVFLHVPKCAGKEIREVLVADAEDNAFISLFNYSYSTRLRRYVDLAHLPLDDLMHWPEFKWLEKYTVIAAIRDPLSRLSSAANEFHRQRSKQEEAVVNGPGLPIAWKQNYIADLPWRHARRDPRYIHSLPITNFTHLGDEPMVDHILHCNTLKDDLLALAKQKGWPNTLIQNIQTNIRNAKTEIKSVSNDHQEWLMAQRLYQRDFQTFGFDPGTAPQQRKSLRSWLKQRLKWRTPGWADQALEQLDPNPCSSHSRELTGWTQQLNWHWGPMAQQPDPQKAWPTTRSR